MNARRTYGPWRTWLTGSLVLAMILVACGPAPTAAPPPTATSAPPTVAAQPTAAPQPTPVPVVEKSQIVVAYDSDIDHVELMQFRSLGGYDATANLYEPLIAAVEAAEGVQIVKLLLENGADANVRDDQDRTAIEVVESQLQYVRNAKDVTSDLREEAESRLIEILDLLRNAGAGRPRPPAQNLLEAAKGGRLDEVKAFLAKGGPVDSRDSNGLTPLIWAAFKGYGDAVTLLLTNGADVNAQSHNGETALMLAAGGGHREVTRGLIEHGGDVNTREKGGGTALMSAVVGRDIAVVKMLLRNGADVNVQTYDDGFTALYFAVMTGQDEIAELLEEAAGKK